MTGDSGINSKGDRVIIVCGHGLGNILPLIKGLSPLDKTVLIIANPPKEPIPSTDLAVDPVAVILTKTDKPPFVPSVPPVPHASLIVVPELPSRSEKRHSKPKDPRDSPIFGKKNSAKDQGANKPRINRRQ